MKEYPLPANALPHTVEIDARAISGTRATRMVRSALSILRPVDHRLQDARPAGERSTHALIFDRQGMAWFTLQQSNMIGRLDPATGAIQLVTTKTPRQAVRDQGRRQRCAVGRVQRRALLYKVDPATMALTEVHLPLAGTTVRRLDIAADGMIWYVNSGMGRLGRYNPQTGEIKEWASPSGPKSHPYAIVVVDGIVWYKSGMRPDALVRLIPDRNVPELADSSGGVYAGIIRHMPCGARQPLDSRAAPTASSK